MSVLVCDSLLNLAALQFSRIESSEACLGSSDLMIMMKMLPLPLPLIIMMIMSQTEIDR